jgi:hypothetical protein
MFTIVSNTHRVTRYVISEAYKWLYKEIEANKYDPSKNHAARALMLRIRKERCLTDDTYSEFLSMMENKPFVYLIRQKNKSGAITTNHIRNYFVKFNEEVLPLGFILDFFEDEYETKEERKKLLDDFIKSESAVEFENHCRTELEKRVEPQHRFREKHPSVFHTPTTFYITNIVRIAFTVVILAMFCMFLSEIKFLNVIGDWMIEAKFDATEHMKDAYGVIEAYTKTVEAGATYSAYFEAFLLHILFNFVIAFILIFRIKTMISFLVVSIKIFSCRLQLGKQEKHMEDLESSGIDELKDHFIELAPRLQAEGQFSADMIENLPAAHKKYHAVVSFDFSKVEKSIKKMHASKSAKKLAITYEDEYDLDSYKKAWRSGFVGLVVITIVIAIINVPGLYNSVIPPIQEWLA